MLAEIFFMTVIGITFLASQAGKERSNSSNVPSRVRTLIMFTWGITFVQFFLGALTRHTDAFAVSATFPHWSPAGFFPSAEAFQYAQVAIYFLTNTVIAAGRKGCKHTRTYGIRRQQTETKLGSNGRKAWVQWHLSGIPSRKSPS